MVQFYFFKAQKNGRLNFYIYYSIQHLHKSHTFRVISKNAISWKNSKGDTLEISRKIFSPQIFMKIVTMMFWVTMNMNLDLFSSLL